MRGHIWHREYFAGRNELTSNRDPNLFDLAFENGVRIRMFGIRREIGWREGDDVYLRKRARGSLKPEWRASNAAVFL